MTPMAIKKSELYSSLWKSCGNPPIGIILSRNKDELLVE